MAQDIARNGRQAERIHRRDLGLDFAQHRSPPARGLEQVDAVAHALDLDPQIQIRMFGKLRHFFWRNDPALKGLHFLFGDDFFRERLDFTVQADHHRLPGMEMQIRQRVLARVADDLFLNRHRGLRGYPESCIKRGKNTVSA